MEDLEKMHCLSGKELHKLGEAEARDYLKGTDGWDLSNSSISKEFVLKDFAEAMRFVDNVAVIAEKEQHHPGITIRWNKVVLTFSTHSVNGLSVNDFIMAAKIDSLSR